MSSIQAGMTFQVDVGTRYFDLPGQIVTVIYVGPPAVRAFPHLDWESWETNEDFVVWESDLGSDFLPISEFKRITE
jgi:hypothetical protein